MDRSRTRPPYPALSSSTTSSLYSSSSSLSSMPSPARAPQDQHSAPLPSPTAEQRHYLGSLNSSSPQQQQQQQTRYFTRSSSQEQQQMAPSSSLSSSLQASSSQQQQQEQQQQQQQQQQPEQVHSGFSYMPDRQATGSTNAQTMAMLADYNLIAEAAKRAQLACMIRDLDEMDMS